MKKISLIFTAIILAIVLIACGDKEKLYAKVKLENIEREKQAIQFDIDLEDPDEQLEGALNIYINLDGERITTKRISLDDSTALEKIRFSGLTIGTSYEVVINGTFLGKTVELLNTKVSTQHAETKEIYTVEDFLAIDGSYSTYKLMNDLDFSEETSSRRIATFRDELDGNGFAIKNYTFTNNITNSGLFGALTSNAKVHNLTIDNMTIEQETPIRTNRYIGFLVGRINSDSVVIESITIKNSKVDYKVDTTSTTSTVRAGFLTGGARGNISNITIEDSNEINLTIDRYASVFVGGLIGEVENNHKLTLNEVVTDGTININVDQTGTDIKVTEDGRKYKDNNHNLRIGGLIGENRNSGLQNSQNLIISTDINYVETNIFVSHKPDLTNYAVKIGGAFGQTVSTIKNALINGNINITTSGYSVTEPEDEEETATTVVARYLNVGGFAGDYLGSFTNFVTVVRSNNNITINTLLEDTSLRVSKGTILGNNNPNFNANKFKLFGTINDMLNEEAFTTEVIDTITDLITHFDNEWYSEKLS